MSKKSSNKQPRLVKGKEEILAELQKSAVWRKRMDFTKNKFWPALVEASMSIDDAKQFVASIPGMVMNLILESYKGRKFGELNLISKLSTTDPKYEKYKAMLELFNDEDVFIARDLIRDMEGEINLALRDEEISRPLSSLKVNWLDEK